MPSICDRSEYAKTSDSLCFTNFAHVLLVMIERIDRMPSVEIHQDMPQQIIKDRYIDRARLISLLASKFAPDTYTVLVRFRVPFQGYLNYRWLTVG